MQHEKKHDMILDLKSNIFASDQTPTPTRLIKNCEEVGLFDDLRHVNPFDETFRRAVEQSECHVSTKTEHEESLHTPQVYPSTDSPLGNAAPTLDVPIVDEDDSYTTTTTSSTPNISYGKLQRYRAEKPTLPVNVENIGVPTYVQLIQPQVIAVTFPSNSFQKIANLPSATIPVQTVKPFILPKPTSISSSKQQPNSPLHPSIFQPLQHEQPSSASLTPTSQLPIKERLKAILNNSKSHRVVENNQKPSRVVRSFDTKDSQYDDGCIERRRAAATRYRNKMRNEHKDLRRRNLELQAENDKLRTRIAFLEQKYINKQPNAFQKVQDIAGSCAPATLPAQIHLVMNIPKLIVPSSGQPILQDPITYSVERK